MMLWPQAKEIFDTAFVAQLSIGSLAFMQSARSVRCKVSSQSVQRGMSLLVLCANQVWV